MKDKYDLGKYELDRDIPNAVWNKYLLKYKNTYKVTKQEDGIFAIMCKYGVIDIYSLKNLAKKGVTHSNLALLLFCGDYTSHSRLKIKLINNLHPWAALRQEGDLALTVIFPESKLTEAEDFFKIRKRRRLKPEHRKKAIETLRLWKRQGLKKAAGQVK